MVAHLDAELAAFSEERLGIFTRADALAIGFTEGQADWRVVSGRWVEEEHETYRLAGTPLTERSRLRAVVANVNRPVAISRGTAAREHGIVRMATDAVHVTVQGRGLLVRRHATVHRTVSLPDCDRTRTFDDIPMTTGERTVVDGAGVRPVGERLALVDEAVCARAADRARLHERACALMAGRAGVASVARATAPDAQGWFRSWLERIADVAMRAAGLPAPEWNAALHDRRGFTIAEIDALWRWAPLGVELDGLLFHSSPGQRQADIRRDRRVLIEAGVPILRYSYRDVVDRRLEMVSEIRGALRQRAAA